MRVPLFNPSSEIDELWDTLNISIEGVLRSGKFIMGPNVSLFESEVSHYLNVKHSIGVNSGTDALVIALRSIGIKPDDEVITSPFTFFATIEAICHLRAKPIFVDVDPITYNINSELIRDVITPKTKAIVPVHLYGQPCNMAQIMELAKEYGLYVVEDCAQSFGARFRNQIVGTIGDVGCFSFFPSKNLGAYGDGGLICTNDDNIAELARCLRTHGSRVKYHNELIGYNSRLDEIQAAILRVKLPHVDEWNESRRRAAKLYNTFLSEMPGIEVPQSLIDVEHVYHQYTIQLESNQRERIRSGLKECGVETMVYYPVSMEKLPVFKETLTASPIANELSDRVLSLPLWPQISEFELQYVIQSLKECL